MPRSSWLSGALLGAVTGLPLIGLFYLGRVVAGLPFGPFDFFDWLARALPGRIVILFIETMVAAINLLDLASTSAVAKAVEQATALLVAVVALAAFGGALGWILPGLPGLAPEWGWQAARSSSSW